MAAQRRKDGMAKTWILAVLALVLAACAPHSLPLYKGEAARIDIDGSTFLVRHTDTRAEATRISPEAAPPRMLMLSRALRAIETASGCAVLPGTLYGDWSLAEAYLDCPGRDPAVLQPQLTHRPRIRPPA